mmetsp:Transcript_39344/g.116617  ORF Transcript_39344/g.116617 Transcript_39344/m.116617 type:complete len:554 (-) Transcript_39344:92-1753(-)
MGKNQHSKDGLHQRPTEWAQDGSGFKAVRRSPFAKLPLNCCGLSLQPFDQPVGTPDGSIFDVAHIVPYIKKFGVNPLTGAKLEVSELIPMHFHFNSEGKVQCPVTFKAFGMHSHVCANMASGQVYSMETVEQLNRKTKNWQDLITGQKFKWSDIVVLQDPDEGENREVKNFYYIQAGQQDEVTSTITHKQTEEQKAANKERIRPNAALERIQESKKADAEEKAAKQEEEDNLNPEAAAARKAVTLQPEPTGPPKRGRNDRYTDNRVAGSFTSTAQILRTQNDLRMMTDAEELEEIYATVKKNKKKGYVRVLTSAGMLNLELHCDMVPRTTDNFLRHCDNGYYDNTIFHRLIKNFMIQGGDPTGTGRGGKSALDDGTAFKDEFDSRLTHQGPGVVSMANSGKNTNKSQFFVSLKSCQHLDLKHAVFGRVVGGLNLLSGFNDLETDEKDRPVKEVKIISTEVFKNPFKEAIAEAEKPKAEELVVDPVATWFSNRRDPMEEHKNRNSVSVGKYLEEARPLPGEKRKATGLPEEEMDYVNVTQKSKKIRDNFDFSKW